MIEWLANKVLLKLFKSFFEIRQVIKVSELALNEVAKHTAIYTDECS